MEKLMNEIFVMAIDQGWKQIAEQPKTSLISFEKKFEYSSKPVRLNVWYKANSTMENFRLTVGTCMDHPKQGMTQLFRKNVGKDLFKKLLINPRQHTNRGYKTK